MAFSTLRASFLCIVLSCTPLARAQSPKAAVNSTAANMPVRDMHRVSISDGWALVGEHIVWTATAGQNWVDITPPLTAGQTIDKVYFLDSSRGWVLLHSADGTGLPAIAVAATEDEGKTWSQRSFTADAFLLQGYAGGDFSFADDKHGWMIVGKMSSSAASRADLFVTTDGGKTWTVLPIPPINGRIQFVSQTTGWLLGGIGNGDLYRTRDGGHTWIRQSVVLPDQVHPYADSTFGPSFVMRPVYCQLSFQTFQNGLLAVGVQVGLRNWTLLTYGAEDGGDSWQLRRVEPDLPGIGSLSAVDSGFLEVAYLGHALSLRRGSARTAAPLPADLPQGQALRKADFLDAEHGWILLATGLPCDTGGCADSALAGTEDGKTFSTLLKSAQTPDAVPSRRSGGQ
ncbi:MAG: hypothetical protein JO340_00365 [Acidobacteriaceae bacterium]|nr:hypothetical protein [Acidobacteriaceae bacterium]